MRPVERGELPIDPGSGQTVQFHDYRDAAPYLKERLGRFCSFCERFIPVQLAVEHVRPKSKHPGLELEWTNFLLACANCNSHKASAESEALAKLRPDLHNTFSALRYSPSGRISATNADDPAANALLKLLGLDKSPAHASNADHRWDDRLEAWGKAQEAYRQWKTGSVAAVLKVANASVKDRGEWSIWMTVFADEPAMKEELIAALPGTAATRLVP